MNIDYTAIILAIISLLGVIITKVLVPYLKANLNEKQLAEINFWVEVAVIAVEKAYESNPGMGEIKKNVVMDFVESMDLPITEYQLEVLIDAVVEELINDPLMVLTE